MQIWLSMANALLWREQRYSSALASRHQWSSWTRYGNRLRRSHWETYGAESGMIVNRNRAGAPKPKAGPAARGRVPDEQ